MIRVASFIFLAPRLHDMGSVLGKAFTHPWVASYQVGFGPPLVKASDRLIDRLRGARTALEKLEAYLECCVYADDERARLASLHRRLTTRRLGPVEAEILQAASADVLDLSLRLHDLTRVRPEVRTEMELEGLTADLFPSDAAPESLAGRFWVHLADPRNTRLLHIDQVRSAVEDPEQALALELRVPAGLRPIYAAWARVLKRDAALEVVDLGEPPALARVSRDGTRT
ncbi:MAG: hypothetical protein KC933_31985 [Myxococcales bacterium]|nr:hypothetical protein [Myxococcales bacterium]MCB9648567.1 hypothetical protein [Deltaproteobacteria bacterium]